MAPKPATAPAAVATTPKTEAVNTPAPRLPLRNELPADVRATLPPTNVSGAVYSPAPRDRLLFINGQVLREGDAVAEGLTIESIGASASVLSMRGQRFQIKH